MTTFEILIDRAAKRGLPKTSAPRTRVEMARTCGLTRQHLYMLMDGQREARDFIVARIAKGLKLSEATVRRALRASREQAKLLA